MTGEDKKMDIEELYRTKLEDSELNPGGELTSHFMSKLSRREFLRFNPSRFNIFYLGGALAAAAITGFLTLSPAREGIVIDAEKQEEVNAFEVPAPQAALRKQSFPGDSMVITKSPEAKTEITGTRVIEENIPVRETGQAEMLTSTGQAAGLKVTETPVKDMAVSGRTMLRAIAQASVTSGCVPLTVSFSSNSSGADKVEWSFGDGGYSDDTDIKYIYDLPGTYNVTLRVTDKSGAQASASLRIDVWPLPKASFEIPDTDVSLTDEDVFFSNLSSGATRYMWDFGDGRKSESFEPSHRYEKFGKYDVTLTAVSENGCVDSVKITDAFTDTGLYLRFPNAFTPGTGGPTGGYYTLKSDLNNQVFHPVSSGVVAYELKIFSKQGLLVFETDDIMNGWDGYYKGQLCSPGVYVWKVRGTYRNGTQIVMTGDVTLLNY